MLTVEGLLADELAALPVVACGPARSPAAARPALMGRAAVCAGGRRPTHVLVLLVAPRVFRAPEAPAAREARQPHFVRRRASKPARALRSLRRPPHQWGRVADRRLGASTRCPARPRRPRGGLQSVGVSVCCPARLAVASLISHVIPQRLVQMLNLHRWNCSVFGVSRKMTTINYVRNLAAGGVVADHGCVARPRPRAPQPGPAAARSPHFVLCSRVLHPIRRHCTPSDRVQCAVTGVVPHRGACG